MTSVAGTEPSIGDTVEFGNVVEYEDLIIVDAVVTVGSWVDNNSAETGEGMRVLMEGSIAISVEFVTSVKSDVAGSSDTTLGVRVVIGTDCVVLISIVKDVIFTDGEAVDESNVEINVGGGVFLKLEVYA